MTPGRFQRVGRGYSRTAALCHPMGRLPQLGVDGLYGRNWPAVCKSTMGDQRSGPSRREGPKENKALRADERAGLT